MINLKHLDLFSGIGGFSFGMEKAGFKTIRFCEIDADCRAVLKNHWPAVPISWDIKNLSLYEGYADVITGGFPCQDLSCIGQCAGINGEKSGLWHEMRRIISEVRPKFAVMENVPNFLSGERGAWFGEFLGSLAEIGYDAEWRCISAAELGFPHKRERLWIVAYSVGLGFDPLLEKINCSESAIKRTTQQAELFVDTLRYSFPAIPEYLRMDDGLPIELDEIKSRVKMLGNSIIPEIAYLIGTIIKEYL